MPYIPRLLSLFLLSAFLLPAGLPYPANGAPQNDGEKAPIHVEAGQGKLLTWSDETTASAGDLLETSHMVVPSEYSFARRFPKAEYDLRQMLVKTAEGFMGTPYRWGRESASTGFDCSGLVMAVYKMNGFNLPRNSKAQFELGKPIAREELRPGDLVFFSTKGGGEVSHVGIYTGSQRFIHAPKPGEPIRLASLDNGYFEGRYLGARSYLVPCNI